MHHNGAPCCCDFSYVIPWLALVSWRAHHPAESFFVSLEGRVHKYNSSNQAWVLAAIGNGLADACGNYGRGSPFNMQDGYHLNEIFEYW